jgi:hypothetical protein
MIYTKPATLYSKYYRKEHQTAAQTHYIKTTEQSSMANSTCQTHSGREEITLKSKYILMA